MHYLVARESRVVFKVLDARSRFVIATCPTRADAERYGEGEVVRVVEEGDAYEVLAVPDYTVVLTTLNRRVADDHAAALNGDL